MTFRRAVPMALVVLSFGFFAASLQAQDAEIFGYAGGFWPDKTPIGQLRHGGIYGVKGGWWVDEHFEFEGNLGYINHFDVRTDLNTGVGLFGRPPIRALVYDVSGSWNFAAHSLRGTHLTPYVTAGAGALTALVRNVDSVFILRGPGRRIVMDDGDTFLTVTYGGGLKALDLWGPMGLRADVHGRSMPNLFGHAVNWPEATGGVTFSWGER